MKKFLRYWPPALLWMGFIFPLTNRSLGSPKAWQVYYTMMVKLIPGASYQELSIGYIALRKTWHFIEYAILALLIYRALRAGREPRWQKPKVLWAGLAAFVFGFLDEFLQSFVPGRRGSPFDWAVDTAGILTGLALLFLWARRRPDANAPSRDGGSGPSGSRPNDA